MKISQLNTTSNKNYLRIQELACIPNIINNKKLFNEFYKLIRNYCEAFVYNNFNKETHVSNKYNKEISRQFHTDLIQDASTLLVKCLERYDKNRKILFLKYYKDSLRLMLIKKAKLYSCHGLAKTDYEYDKHQLEDVKCLSYDSDMSLKDELYSNSDSECEFQKLLSTEIDFSLDNKDNIYNNAIIPDGVADLLNIINNNPLDYYVFFATYHYNMTKKEISSVLGINLYKIDLSRSRISKAMKKIKGVKTKL